MIKELNKIDPYLEFINELNADACYSDPMLSTQEQIQHNLMKAIMKKDNKVWGVFEEDTLIGLFVFLVIEEEKYAEMIVGLSKNKKAYEELFQHLTDEYPGYQIDFVYNPKNDLLQHKLEEVHAEFEIEQQKMILTNYQKVERKHQVFELTPEYQESYLKAHDDEDKYWVGSKVLEATDKFRIFVCVMDEQVVGYVDVTYIYEENEPYDVFVISEYRNRGIATELLSLAIEKNEDKQMMLLVDIDNEAALHVYEKIGFEKATKGNNVTAHWNR